jgi:nitrate reductase delta subunit
MQKAAVEEVREQVSAEKRDDSLEALDAEWEEEMITFLNGDKNSSCGTSAGTQMAKHVKNVAAPVHWVDFKQSATPAGKA